MKTQLLCVGLLTSIVLCSQAMFMRPDLDKVPTDRLITNLTQKAQNKSNDVQILYALARVHAMAFAKGHSSFDVNRKDDLPFFGFVDRGFLGHEKVTATNETAGSHLKQAIEIYGKALKIKSDHLPSQVGLGWCLDQAGKKEEAKATYRKALDQAWGQEKKAGSTFDSSISSEVCDYLLPLLNAQTDADEIKRVKEIKEQAERLPRAITPLLVALEDGLVLDQMVDTQAAVPFDLDGSGVLRQWQWPTPKAGWLAYDPNQSGEVRSGLQLFGAVSFWIFWENGYEALAALDDNQDGVLSGPELEGLVIWRDANSNGISEPGEVQSLSVYGITALDCGFQRHASGIPYNPAGAMFKDGHTRPTFDWNSSAK